MPERQRFRDARRDLLFAYERNTSLCTPFLSVLPVSGAAVSVLAGAKGQSTVSSSDATAARIDELQFDLGEGPCWDALSTRAPALHPDVVASGRAAWPVFENLLHTDPLGNRVRALFAFPLFVGSLDIGAIDFYSSSTAPLGEDQISDATELASVAAWQVLRHLLGDAAADDAEGPSTRNRREVHQATGMVLAQLDITADEASLLLRAHAFSSGRSVADVAHDVVLRRLDFSTDGGQGDKE
jgi:hypothetical protein